MTPKIWPHPSPGSAGGPDEGWAQCKFFVCGNGHSAVKSHPRTKPAALSKDGSRSVPSAPPSSHRAVEAEALVKRRVKKSK
ncbi:hypothetical protein PoB_000623600 [Plakobranchus ocellatus]|uniref:Uncharacterized protein n=1 Tax=Plakobranchus ocellatus TaxID=259542 RepID=A0AAV3XXQ3_9GAST|nr:hypothetical protein PoB_000623600 [Plakobranchus ocellatus]